jgi:hypothetical protein
LNFAGEVLDGATLPIRHRIASDAVEIYGYAWEVLGHITMGVADIVVSVRDREVRFTHLLRRHLQEKQPVALVRPDTCQILSCIQVTQSLSPECPGPVLICTRRSPS